MLLPESSRQLLEQKDILAPNKPYVAFVELYDKEKRLYPNAGFNPIFLRLSAKRLNLADTVLVVEASPPPQEFSFRGIKFIMHELESRGGRVLTGDLVTGKTQYGYVTGLPWTTADITLVGDPGVVAGNKITLSSISSEAMVLIKATTSVLKHYLFRVRRAHDTQVTAEVLGVGTGALTLFSFTTANGFICPGSVKINFTDSGGAKVGLIREDGGGRLVTLAPDPLLGESVQSTINYETGKIEIQFSVDHIPTATNITIDYEYASGGVADQSDCRVDWRAEM